MGDVDEGDVHLALETFELELHLFAQFEVQRAEGFVQQQHARLVDQAARNGHALLLPARKLVDAAALEAFQADDLQHFQHFGADLAFRRLFQPQAKGDVLEHIEMREQRVFLEHRVDRALVGRQVGDVLAIKKDIARFWGDEPGDHAQGRGLAAARRAEEGHELLVVNVEGKPVQDFLPVKIDYNVFE